MSRVSATCATDALRSRAHEAHQIELTQNVAAHLADLAPDTVLPMLHGSPGEDGCVQGLLDILGYSYVGSGQTASATAIHKSLTKAVARRADLPVAPEVVLLRGEDVQLAGTEVLRVFGSSLALKPDDQGSALGVRLLHGVSHDELCAELQELLGQHEQLLIEPFREGSELTVGVLDLHGEAAQAFPVIEIRTPENTWYDFHHRYTKGESEHIIPAEIPASAAERLQEYALVLHQQLGCRDLSRVDFIRSPEGEITVLELNNLPGMTPTSLYPDGARAFGIEFDELLERLVGSAYVRGPSISWSADSARL